MKKILQLFVLAAFIPSFAAAQITIESSQIQLVGFSGIQSRDTVPDATIVPGGSGAQSWDFTSLKDQGQDTLKFYEVAETPYASLFPGTNIAATLDSFVYLYFEQTADYLKTHGSYGTLNYEGFTVTTSYLLSPPQTVIKFPMALNNTSSEYIKATIQIPGSTLALPYDSIRAVTRTQRNVEVDGFGQMTTPAGVYETLRSKEVEISTDSLYFLNNGFWQLIQGSPVPDTITLFNWWTAQNGLGLPVVQLEQKSSGQIQATWLLDYVSGTHTPASLLQFSVSPNPTSDFLKVELPEAFDGKLEVYDLNGRLQIIRTAVPDMETVDVQALAAGSYVLVLKDKTGSLIGFERFAVVK